MILLDANSSVAVQEIVTLIGALGLGFIFPLPLIALQAAMPPSSIATATATFGLLRTLGGAVGISIAGSVYGSDLTNRLSKVAGFNGGSSLGSASSALTYPISSLANITPASLRMQVIQEYCLALRLIWIVITPIVGVAFLLTFLLKVYSLNRATTRLPGKSKGVPDAEKATIDNAGANAVAGEASKDAAPL